jgi:3-dehydroquinate dehydratase type I
MKKPRICVTLVENNLETVKEIEPLIDLFELRLDLIGPEWPELAKFIQKPWIACNRSPEEGGKGSSNEISRVEELMWAAEAGACIVDIEYRINNLTEVVALIKPKAECLISFHDMVSTPSYNTLVRIAEGQLRAGADICKIVTTAQNFEDNLTILKLIRNFPEARMVAFAMAEAGRMSRILSPLAGGYFTYACTAVGKESAAGQVPLREMMEIYEIIRVAS